MKSGSLNDLNITLPQLSKEKLLANDFFGPEINVYEVKKIDIHEDFKTLANNDIAILTVAKPFDSETQKGELQTKSYDPKSKVQCTANVCRELQGLYREIGVQGFQIYGDCIYTCNPCNFEISRV